MALNLVKKLADTFDNLVGTTPVTLGLSIPVLPLGAYIPEAPKTEVKAAPAAPAAPKN